MSTMRALGLVVAMVATVALTAAPRGVADVGEAAASAGAATQGGHHRFLLEDDRAIECSAAEFSGVAAEEASFTLTPSYLECSAELLGAQTTAAIEANGCAYRLRSEKAAAGRAAAEGWQYAGSLTVECPPGREIEAQILEANGSGRESDASLCTYKIGEQGPLKSVAYKADDGGGVKAKVALGPLSLSRTSGTITNCGAVSQTGTYVASASLEPSGAAKSDPNALLDLAPRHPREGGRITAAKYPTRVEAFQAGKTNELVLPDGQSFHCESASFAGSYTGADSRAQPWSVTLTPEYVYCIAVIDGNFTTAIPDLNSCHYEFTSEAISGSSEPVGALYLKCPQGEEMELGVWQTTEKYFMHEPPFCAYRIAEQGPLRSLKYSLGGTGADGGAYLTVGGRVPVVMSRIAGTLNDCGAASQTAELTTEAKVEALQEAEPLGLTIDR